MHNVRTRSSSATAHGVVARGVRGAAVRSAQTALAEVRTQRRGGDTRNRKRWRCATQRSAKTAYACSRTCRTQPRKRMCVCVYSGSKGRYATSARNAQIRQRANHGAATTHGSKCACGMRVCAVLSQNAQHARSAQPRNQNANVETQNGGGTRVCAAHYEGRYDGFFFKRKTSTKRRYVWRVRSVRVAVRVCVCSA